MEPIILASYHVEHFIYSSGMSLAGGNHYLSLHDPTELFKADAVGEVPIESLNHGLEQIIVDRTLPATTAFSVCFAAVYLVRHLPKIVQGNDPLVIDIEQTKGLLQICRSGASSTTVTSVGCVPTNVQGQLDIDSAVTVIIVVVIRTTVIALSAPAPPASPPLAGGIQLGHDLVTAPPCSQSGAEERGECVGADGPRPLFVENVEALADLRLERGGSGGCWRHFAAIK